MKNEHLGAFIDAIYAIAITMLALDIPVELKSHDTETIRSLLAVLIQYCLSFAMLFGFWLQHRQVNQYLTLNRFSIGISAALLLVISLLPRATRLVYDYGDQPGTIFQLNFSETIDILFISILLLADVLMGQLVLRMKIPVDSLHPDAKSIRRLRQAKAIITTGIVGVTIAIFLIPTANRNLLWFIAFLLAMQIDVDLLTGTMSRFSLQKTRGDQRSKKSSSMQNDSKLDGKASK